MLLAPRRELRGAEEHGTVPETGVMPAHQAVRPWMNVYSAFHVS